LFGTLVMGFLVGMGHALEPDHLAAVASLSANHAKRWHAIRQGAFWGLGHTLVLFALGGLVLILGQTIPESFERFAEGLVGAMLIALGLDVTIRTFRDRPDEHHPFRALTVGMVHGMAGSAALVLLAVSLVDSWHWGLIYIFCFGIGSILGMSLLSLAIGLPLTYLRVARRGARITIGSVAIAVGIAMVLRQLV